MYRGTPVISAFLSVIVLAVSIESVVGDVPSSAAAQTHPRIGAVRTNPADGDTSGDDAAGPEPRGPGALCQEPSNNCQAASLLNAWRSDGQGLIAADDFRPAQSSVDNVCWWGTYGEVEVAVDAFVITYYEGVAGTPGAEIASFSQAGGSLIVNGPVATGRARASLTEYEYVATHAPVALEFAQCYWIEIRNDVAGNKRWYWSVSETGGVGNGRAIQDGLPLNGYEGGDFVGDDLAFCLNVFLISASECKQEACCVPGDP